MTDSARDAAKSQMLYHANAKSVGVTYLLWFFLGMLGAHRFYAGSTGLAVLQLIIFVISWPLLLAGIGFITLGILWLWVLIDAFMIPGLIRDYNTKLAGAVLA